MQPQYYDVLKPGYYKSESGVLQHTEYECLIAKCLHKQGQPPFIFYCFTNIQN
jgi:hypothetical protein